MKMSERHVHNRNRAGIRGVRSLPVDLTNLLPPTHFESGHSGFVMYSWAGAQSKVKIPSIEMNMQHSGNKKKKAALMNAKMPALMTAWVTILPIDQTSGRYR